MGTYQAVPYQANTPTREPHSARKKRCCVRESQHVQVDRAVM